MKQDERIKIFLGNFDKQAAEQVFKIRKVIAEILPDIIEHVDLPARMIAYVYGQKYSEMVCTIIPSKKKNKAWLL
jgi:hypothetical protein